ncbi:hypothetical protein A9Q99_01085 [Gammaproteobacteria bacterium 45_16_T64]|nr:hypothetical protein A9Q99_01085 [Gammaproteobacteria bacterium 45_16_T64]
MVDKKQITFAVLLMTAIAVFFWTQSRFPALDTKAQMGQRTSISAIAFDVILPVVENAPFIERVGKSAVNWGYTNWKGMTFGLIFAAAFLTLLRLLPTLPPSRFHFINALKGLAIGVPLGVCANCSTPIAHGMVQAGSRVETALATLTSSPTLNIFVLTMSFSLLPTHLALIKLFGVLVFVLLVLPYLVKMSITQSTDNNSKAGTLQKSLSDNATNTLTLNSLPAGSCELPTDNWGSALRRVTQKFTTNLRVIVQATLPLMVLAGILGAIAIESVPFSLFQNATNSALALLGISVIGAFLPVPIAFDIIIVTTLLAIGFPVGLSMALLFSLGIFSIYPAMVIARQVSPRLSANVFVVVVIFSSILGFFAETLHKSIISSTKASISDIVDNNVKISPHTIITEIAAKECLALSHLPTQIRCQKDALLIIDASEHLSTTEQPALPLNCNNITEPNEQMQCYSLLSMQHAIHSKDIQKCNYIQLENIKQDCSKTIVLKKIASIYGIETARMSIESTPRPDNISPLPTADEVTSTELPAWQLIHHQEGISIFSTPLAKRSQHASAAKQLPVFASIEASTIGIRLPSDFTLSDFYEPFSYGRGVASGDINNDNYPDLVFATASGPRIFLNLGGNFQEIHLPLTKRNQLNTFLVSFVDINNDGWLDLFFTTYGGRNFLVQSQSDLLTKGPTITLPNVDANLTLSAGFSDKDNDGDLDVFLGNWTSGAENSFSTTRSQNAWLINDGTPFRLLPDNEVNGETLSVLFSDFTSDNISDLALANDNQGPDLYFTGDSSGKFSRLPPNAHIPVTSLTTMSIDTADINNDLLLDIFTTDMSFGKSEVDSYCSNISTANERSICLNNLTGWHAIKEFNPEHCKTYNTSTAQQQCIIGFIISLAKTSKDSSICNKIPHAETAKKHLCYEISQKLQAPTYSLSNYTPQEQSNKLLLAQANGQFVDATQTMQADASFWSWNSKIADLDNDQWQDIFVGNGFGFGDTQNEIHSNVLYQNQSGRTFINATEQFGLTQFLNTPSYTYADIDLDGDIDIIATTIMGQPQVYLNHSEHKSITFRLIDHTKNRSCIGCKLIITYGDNEKQLRELKLSGGFLSFDDPVMFFGLQKHTVIKHVKIIWSDGTISSINKALTASNHYKIERSTL